MISYIYISENNNNNSSNNSNNNNDSNNNILYYVLSKCGLHIIYIYNIYLSNRRKLPETEAQPVSLSGSPNPSIRGQAAQAVRQLRRWRRWR